MAKQKTLGSLWGAGGIPPANSPQPHGLPSPESPPEPSASLPAQAPQKEAGEPPPTPFRPLPGKAGVATGNANPRQASQAQGQGTPDPRKAELGGSTALLSLQGSAGRGPSRPQAGVQGPGCTSWGPGGHQAQPSRKPSRCEGVWGGAAGRSWAGGRNRRARGGRGEKSPRESAPDPTRTKPGSEHGHPLPDPCQRTTLPRPPGTETPWQGAGRPSGASWDTHPQPPPSGRTASPGTRRRQKWQPWGLRRDHGAPGFGGGGAWGPGGQEGPQAPREGGLSGTGAAPFCKWACLLCTQPLQSRVPA